MVKQIEKGYMKDKIALMNIYRPHIAESYCFQFFVYFGDKQQALNHMY